MRTARLYRTPVPLVWLTFLWLALWGDLSWANLVSGLAVGAILLWSVGARPARRGDEDAPIVSPLATIRFLLWVVVKLIQSNLILAWEIVTPRNQIHTGVVAVPLRTESPMAVMVVASVITLTPGTLTIEVAGSPPVLYVHVLHLHDLERVRQDLLDIESRSVLAFGSSRARAQLAGSDRS